jgi:hypothetical protein
VRLRIVVAVLVTLAALAGVGIFVAVRMLSNGLPIQLPIQQCVAKGAGTATLDPQQMANAATIAAVGIRRGVPDHAVTIALATAMQESKLQNLEGGDRDSLGLFQQRPSQDWGTPAQIMDPRYSAMQFYKALMKIKGWENLTVAQAAQAVQKSADGSLYARWEDKARVLASALTGEESGALGCTIVERPAQHGTAAVTALVEDLTGDWGTDTASADGGTVAVTVRDVKTGWQYAHWLVAHAADRGIHRVRYADQVWSTSSTSWTKATTPATDRVIAEVFP